MAENSALGSNMGQTVTLLDNRVQSACFSRVLFNLVKVTSFSFVISVIFTKS